MEGFKCNEALVLEDLQAQVQRALQLLDSDVREAYDQAVDKVPHLVQQESRVHDFLRVEDFHALRAAHRIALFWKTRRDLFGEDRWLLPMTQTGRGALTPDQVELLRTGFVAMTAEPQAVALYDGSRLPISLQAIPPEIIFYLNTVSTSVAAQTEGYYFCHVLQRDRAGGPRLAPETAQQLTACLPTKPRALIIGQVFDNAPAHYAAYAAHQDLVRTRANFSGRTAAQVIGWSVSDTLQQLQHRGMHRACIPVALGGDYMYSQHFDAWVRARLSVEDGMMAAAPPIRNTAAANQAAVAAIQDQQHQFVARRQNRRSSHASSLSSSGGDGNYGIAGNGSDSCQGDDGSHSDSNQPPKQPLVARRPGESKEDFEKRRTYVYGKRSYQKRRREIQELEEKAKHYESARVVLQQDNRKLEALLVQARLMAAMIEEEKNNGSGEGNTRKCHLVETDNANDDSA